MFPTSSSPISSRVSISTKASLLIRDRRRETDRNRVRASLRRLRSNARSCLTIRARDSLELFAALDRARAVCRGVTQIEGELASYLASAPRPIRPANRIESQTPPTRHCAPSQSCRYSPRQRMRSAYLEDRDAETTNRWPNVQQQADASWPPPTTQHLVAASPREAEGRGRSDESKQKTRSGERSVVRCASKYELSEVEEPAARLPLRPRGACGAQPPDGPLLSSQCGAPFSESPATTADLAPPR